MDNTVGSRKNIVLTKRQEEILLGKLLGDGLLEKNGRNVRLKIDHGARQKKYVDWLYEEFKSFSLRPYQVTVQDKRNGHFYVHWRFASYSLPIFNEWKTLFYVGRKKIVPLKITELLSPLALAILYMDDGFRRRDCRALYLCTSSYTLQEQVMLQYALKERYSIITRLHFARSNMRIYIPSKESDKFCQIVRQFILPIFNYKLFDPVTTDSLTN